MNDEFNDDDPEINIDGFSITREDHYVNFDGLNLLSSYNNDTKELVFPNNFIPITKNPGDI